MLDHSFSAHATQSFDATYFLTVVNRFDVKSEILVSTYKAGAPDVFVTYNGSFVNQASGLLKLDLGDVSLNGEYSEGQLTWSCAADDDKACAAYDGGAWQLQSAPDFGLAAMGSSAPSAHGLNGAISGVYTSNAIYKSGTYVGVRIVSLDPSAAVNGYRQMLKVLGSDDGIAWWSASGNYTPASFNASHGSVTIDFSGLGLGVATGAFPGEPGTLSLSGASGEFHWTRQSYKETEGGGALVGYVAVAIAVLGFGTNFVPVKRFETGDGIFFQWVMCTAIWCWGLALQLVLFAMRTDCVPGVDLGCAASLTDGRVDAYSLKFIPQAVAGGVLWATGNIMAVPVINSIGLGMGMLIWGCTNMLMGWATGIARLDKNTADPGLLWLNGLGVALAVVALAMYILIKPAKEPAAFEGGAGRDELLVQVSASDVIGGGSTVLPGEGKTSAASKRLLGTLGAVLSGILYGNNFTPPNLLLNTHTGPAAPLDYVFSHFCGIFATSTFWFLVYCVYKKSTPVLYPRVILPGFISGLMWAAAQTSWFVANASLSVAVAFPLITSGPGIVGSLLGVFVFGEIQGKRNYIVLCIAILLAVVGCTLIGIAKGMA